jgi:hypothetical protein
MVFYIKKLIKGPKKVTKEAKKSINRSWQLIITIANLEIDSRAKRPPLPKIVIPRATVDETDFCLE